VLIVDDHRMVAEALRMRLGLSGTPRRRFAPVTTAYSVQMARAALSQATPDLVLLDFHLGESSALDLVVDLEGLPVPPVCLILAANAAVSDVIEGLAHASGWVSKGTATRDMLSAIETVLAGRTYVDPRLLGPVLDQLMIESGRRAGRATFLDKASERELEVLRCLVSGMTRQETAAHLFISTNTVRTHVQRLLRHAGVHSTLSLIAAARDLGVEGIETGHE